MQKPPGIPILPFTAGGESGDPRSPHFNDQAERYAGGGLRPVYYYPEDVEVHAEEMYRPGEREPNDVKVSSWRFSWRD